MNNKLKYSLIIISTLLIGFIIGFLVSGRLTHQRMEKMKQNYADQGFAHDFMHMIKPTPEQREELKPIFERYGDLNREMVQENIEAQRELFEGLEEEITPFLNEEQLERLQRFKKHWRDRRSNKRHKKPHSGSKPPR